jgi:hypothetical protein
LLLLVVAVALLLLMLLQPQRCIARAQYIHTVLTAVCTVLLLICNSNARSKAKQ